MADFWIPDSLLVELGSPRFQSFARLRIPWAASSFQSPGFRITLHRSTIYVVSWSGSPSSQIKLSQKLLWPIHTQFPAALFAPVKVLVGRGRRWGGGGFYMKCLKCSSSFWEIGQKASIFTIKLLFRIFSNEYMQGKPNSFKTGLKTTLKFNIPLGSSMLTYPDRPCKNGNMWPYDWKKIVKKLR